MYLYYRTITIDYTKCGTSDSSNFPLLVSGTYAYLATVANGGRVTNASGYDIIFTSDVAGETKLDHEIESYNAVTGAINFWVRIPTVSYTADTVIYMQYGNSSISSSQENITGVWDSNFKGVWHLKDNAASTTVIESTSNANTGTAQANTNTKTTTGKIDTALTFNGSSDYITALRNISDDMTLSVWFKTASAGSGTLHYQTLSLITAEVAGSTADFGMGIDSNGKLAFGTGTSEATIAGATTVNDNSWRHACATRIKSSGAIVVYVNGSSNGSGTGDSGTSLTAASNLRFGDQDDSPHNFFNGPMDEIRISNIARSANWVLTEYNNQNSPSTFYVISAERISSISSNLLQLSDRLITILQSYRIDATPALLSDLILASVLVPPKLLTDTQVLADSVLRVLHQYRLVTDTAALSDALVFTIQRYRGLLDSASPSSDKILVTLLQRDTVSSNRAKPISRPRWLFDVNISGTRRFSSEDLEKP